MKSLLLYLFALFLLFLHFGSSAENYYPLKVGNYWTYLVTTFDKPDARLNLNYTIKITNSKMIENKKNFVSAVFINDEQVSKSYLYLSGNRIYKSMDVIDGKEFGYNPPLIIFDFGSNLWHWEGKYNSYDCMSNGKIFGLTSYKLRKGNLYAIDTQNVFNCSDGSAILSHQSVSPGIGIVSSKVFSYSPDKSSGTVLELLDYN